MEQSPIVDKNKAVSGGGVLRVLREIRARVRRDGWVGRRGPGGVTLLDAWLSGEATVDRWNARLLLDKMAGARALTEWAEHSYRTQREVLALLDKAIRHLGGNHRGGWGISAAPVVVAEVRGEIRALRLLAARKGGA